MFLRLTTILLLSYYLFGNLCLPQSDFSALSELPGMYRHCKATEDKDMSPIDFITDHLINIDGLFDKHENDEQKPHTPNPQNHQLQQSIFVLQQSVISIEIPECYKEIAPIHSDDFYRSEYVSGIFRPPIV